VAKSPPEKQLDQFLKLCLHSLHGWCEVCGYDYDSGSELPQDELKEIAQCNKLPALADSALAEFIIGLAGNVINHPYPLQGPGQCIERLAMNTLHGSMQGIFYNLQAQLYERDSRGNIVHGHNAFLNVEPDGKIALKTSNQHLKTTITHAIKHVEPNKNARKHAEALLKALLAHHESGYYCDPVITPFVIINGVADLTTWRHSPNAFCETVYGSSPQPVHTQEYRHVECLYDQLTPAKQKKIQKILMVTSKPNWPYQIFAETDREDFYRAYSTLTTNV